MKSGKEVVGSGSGASMVVARDSRQVERAVSTAAIPESVVAVPSADSASFAHFEPSALEAGGLHRAGHHFGAGRSDGRGAGAATSAGYPLLLLLTEPCPAAAMLRAAPTVAMAAAAFEVVRPEGGPIDPVSLVNHQGRVE